MAHKPLLHLALLAVAVLALAPCQTEAQPDRRFRRLTLPPATQQLLRQQAIPWVLKVRNGQTDSVQVRDIGSLTLDPADQMVVIPRAGKPIPDVWIPHEAALPGAGPVLALPEDYLLRVEGNQVAHVRPLFRTGQPMRYEEGSGSFRGVLLVVLKDETHPSERRMITPAMSFRVASTADLVEPEDLRLDSTNVVAEIEFEARNPMDSVAITFITDRQPEGYEAHIPVDPALLIETPGRALQGWGIQSVPVTVVVRGARIDEPVAVTLAASKGSVTPGTVYVSTAQAASAKLRSEGLGSAEFSAISPRFITARQTFHYAFPFSYFLFATVGAVLGGLLAHLIGLQKKKPTNLIRNLGGAAVWGLVVSAAYLGLGVNLLALHLPAASTFNEIIVFTVSAIAGLTWGSANARALDTAESSTG